MEPKRTNEIPGVRKSSRVKFQTKQYYIPSISGYKYAVSVSQLEDHIALHTDVHFNYDTTFTKDRIERVGNKIPQLCALSFESTALHRHIQYN